MKIKPLFKFTNATDFLCKYLMACGVEKSNLDLFLYPDSSCEENPWDYVNMDEAVDRLHEAIVNKQKVGIICDADCDGHMSATVANQFLKSQGLSTTIFTHMGKTHGLTINQDENMVEQVKDSGVQLLWIPDAGSHDAKQCKQLKDCGIDVLVTDHHPTTIEANPYAIVVNPHIKGNINLSGTAVTNLVVVAYCEKYGLPKPNYLDLVGLSTISDAMDLSACVNRWFLTKGLVDNKNINPFIQKLIKKYGRGEAITPHMLSWNVIPKINAVTRCTDIDTKRLVIEALNTDNEEIQDEAVKQSQRAHNHQVKTVKKMMEEIEPTLDMNHKGIVGFTDSSNKEYIGLVAGKIAGKYGKPCFLLRDSDRGSWTGSFRSNVPLVGIIKGCGIEGVGAEGQPSAAGVWMPKAKLDEFIEFIDSLPLEVEPEVEVTCELKIDEITTPLCKEIESNEILWGTGVPKPMFYINTKANNANVQVFRKKTNTVKLTIGDIDFMLFQASDEDIELLTETPEYNIEMLVELQTNEWNGVVSPQAMVKKFEVKPIEHEEVDWEDLF